ncbi:S-adenosylmethionine decarboxylase [Serendipita vermifera]|nr:S-adenosylmethionine decarboxylase [Serendipita vermifera]
MSEPVAPENGHEIAEEPLMNAPFEGPEKLLEIWFEVPTHTDTSDERWGLRSVPREKWEEMLDIVRCKVLNVLEGKELDAYLLSESSLFIYPNKLILKTCGTTLNLLGLPRILELAKETCSMTEIRKCFYSRKSFMFPERQQGPHRGWKEEVQYLDNMFPGGAAYTVGKMNGDHWLLWLIDTTAVSDSAPPSPIAPFKPLSQEALDKSEEPLDYTLEILMSNLSSTSRENFYFPELANASEAQVNGDGPSTARTQALELSEKLGISSIFPPSLSQIDAYAFDPCGYSANGVITPRNPIHGEGYWTIHVTPEEGWSYASFECNVPSSAQPDDLEDLPKSFPTLHQLIQRVIDIFEPGNLSITLFVSSSPSSLESPIEHAQSVFRKALLPKGYKRTDKITYEFSGYDLAFASFQK